MVTVNSSGSRKTYPRRGNENSIDPSRCARFYNSRCGREWKEELRGRNAAKKQLSKKRSIDDFHRGAPLPPRVPPSEEVSPSLLFPAWINDTVVESGIIEIYVVAGERQGGKRARRRRARHGWNKKGERKKGERKKEEERSSLGEQVN